jgi:hypothetical protein
VPREINLDELSYDQADQKRIPKYTTDPRKQDEIRRMYLAKSLVDTNKHVYFLLIYQLFNRVLIFLLPRRQ